MTENGRELEAVTANTERSRWVALVVLCAGMLMIVLDATVVNVALPSIQSDLGFSQSGLAWVVNAYLIAFGGLLLLAGRLGDLISRRGVFLAGLAVFTLASLVCGAAQSQEMLVAARFVQGVGGAMTSAVILGMIVTMFPEPREQAKAIGVYGFVASAGGSIGLLAGGVLTQAIDWHWIFFVNLPIGDRRRPCWRCGCSSTTAASASAGGADVPGALLVTGALMLARLHDRQAGGGGRLGRGARSVSARSRWRCWPRSSPARRRRATRSMPLRIFRSRNVAGRERDPGAVGRRHVRHVLPRRAVPAARARLRPAADRPRLPAGTLVMGTLSLRYSERLIMRFGAPRTLIPGLVLIAAGARAVRAGAGGRRLRLPHVLPAMVLLGAGVGVCLPGADDAGDVGRHAERRGPGLRPGQHDRAGRRRARAGRARDARRDAHRDLSRRRQAPRPR